MRVLLLCTHLNPGGVSRYILTLSKGLKKKNHSVYTACSQGEWVNKLNEASVSYKYIPIRTKFIFSFKVFLSFFILLKFVKENKIDIIHANTRVTQFLGFLLYKFTGIPYVATFHGFHRKKWARKFMRCAGTRTIAVSASVKKHLMADFGIKENRIKVVYNGVEREEFSEHFTKKTDYGFSEKQWVIGILGRISEEKGYFLAVEAIKLLSYDHDNIYLAISGKGKLEKELKEFIKIAEIEHRVKFFDIEAKRFLDIPDILIVPSKKEGFGYTVIEGFLKGIPVVGFNVGGISEIIKNRQNGLLFYQYEGFYLKESIIELISNKDLRNKLIRNAKEDAQCFSMENMANNTEEVYNETTHEKNI